MRVRLDWYSTHVRLDAEPTKIGCDLIRVFLLRARGVGIVEAQDEPAVVLQRIDPVEQRGAHIPIWMLPVGEGAKRTVVVIFLFSVMVLRCG
jgi:hypothetical protein